jgi:molecular chaperone HscB
MNYFELFDLPVSFSIDQVLLKKKFYQLSKNYHPDFYEKNDTISEEENLQMSSKVNEGYVLLQNKYAIIGYVLKLKGFVQEEEKYNLAPSFLMEVMELNEDLNDTSIIQINKLSEEIALPISTLLSMENLDDLSVEDWGKIKEYYYQKKYLNRLQQRVNGVTAFE